MKVAIGIDTSCYTTSVALVCEKGNCISSFRKLLPVKNGTCGLRQSEAVFVHIKQLPILFEQLTDVIHSTDCEVVAIGVSSAPRPSEDSYMPVFLTGTSYARVIASSLKLPLFYTSHQQGHIAAGLLNESGPITIPSPHLALHISGGTTDFILVNQDTIDNIGGSLDLHAGQLVDRIGVAFGFGFPAGKALEALALTCTELPLSLLPVSMSDSDLHCHLSGAEAQLLRLIKSNKYSQAQLALELFDFLSRTLCRLIIAGCKQTQINHVLIVGGVASSTLLRTLIQRRLEKQRRYSIKIHWGKPEYSTDNAAGVASIAMSKYLQL